MQKTVNASQTELKQVLSSKNIMHLNSCLVSQKPPTAENLDKKKNKKII